MLNISLSNALNLLGLGYFCVNLCIDLQFMRIIITIFILSILLSLSFTSCVKRPSKSPTPELTFKDFIVWRINGVRDSAVAIIGYEDGDGDLFLNKTTDGPNIVGTFYYLNSATGKFTGISDPITGDTARVTQTVLQPKGASYKGKSVQGEIFLPLAPFRSGDSVKVFKYTFVMQDEAGHKTNTITTPELKAN